MIRFKRVFEECGLGADGKTINATPPVGEHKCVMKMMEPRKPGGQDQPVESTSGAGAQFHPYFVSFVDHVQARLGFKNRSLIWKRSRQLNTPRPWTGTGVLFGAPSPSCTNR